MVTGQLFLGYPAKNITVTGGFSTGLWKVLYIVLFIDNAGLGTTFKTTTFIVVFVRKIL